MVNEKNSNGLIGVIFFGIFLIFALSIITTKIEIESEFSCDSGFIGIEANMLNDRQSKVCDYDKNFTCFKDDTYIDYMKLKNIDGVNCHGKFKSKIPLVLAFAMGGQ